MTEVKQERFMFFANFAEAIQELPEEEHAEAYKAICEYGIYGILPKNKTLKGMCIMSMPSLFKKEKRGGNHNPTGKNQHSDDEVKEVKTGQSGQNGQTGQSFLKQKLKLETETETETETENLCEKEKRKSPDLKNAIKPVNSFVKNKVLVSESLSLVDSDDEDINAYLNEFGKKVVLDVQEWLIKNKIGKEVDKDFICRQIRNFQERQRK